MIYEKGLHPSADSIESLYNRKPLAHLISYEYFHFPLGRILFD
jgi:hypothetical protein